MRNCEEREEGRVEEMPGWTPTAAVIFVDVIGVEGSVVELARVDYAED